MVLIRTAHEHGTIIECEDSPNYFGFEEIQSTTDIFTRIWICEEEGIDECTGTTIRKHKFHYNEISTASCVGNIEDMESKIKELQLATAIAKSYET